MIWVEEEETHGELYTAFFLSLAMNIMRENVVVTESNRNINALSS